MEYSYNYTNKAKFVIVMFYKLNTHKSCVPCIDLSMSDCHKPTSLYRPFHHIEHYIYNTHGYYKNMKYPLDNYIDKYIKYKHCKNNQMNHSCSYMNKNLHIDKCIHNNIYMYKHNYSYTYMSNCNSTRMYYL